MAKNTVASTSQRIATAATASRVTTPPRTRRRSGFTLPTTASREITFLPISGLSRAVRHPENSQVTARVFMSVAVHSPVEPGVGSTMGSLLNALLGLDHQTVVIECRRCGASVDDPADDCPHCGPDTDHVRHRLD